MISDAVIRSWLWEVLRVSVDTVYVSRVKGPEPGHNQAQKCWQVSIYRNLLPGRFAAEDTQSLAGKVTEVAEASQTFSG